MTLLVCFLAFVLTSPLFLYAGRPSFRESGVPAHGNPTTSSCCCPSEPADPCGFCNAGKNPRVIEATLGPTALADHTCLGCNGKYAGVYILAQTLDSACTYTYCEPDSCQALSPGGDPCQTKFYAGLNNNGAAFFTMGFCDTSPNCGETATPSAIRQADWELPAFLPDFIWDCVDELDHDLAPVMPVDGNIDYDFCHEAGNIHLKAIP